MLLQGLLLKGLLVEASGGLTALFLMSLVTYWLGHLARVVIRQELGGGNQNELNLQYPGTTPEVAVRGSSRGELLGYDPPTWRTSRGRQLVEDCLLG